MFYHFLDLTHEQKLQRREYLDWYGFLAQISVLVPLLGIQVYLAASWVQRNWWWQRNRKGLDQTAATTTLPTLSGGDGTSPPPSSPFVKQRRSEQRDGLINIPGLAARWRRFTWWCGDSVNVAGYHLGRKGEILGAGLWTAWLLTLSFLQTGDDYMHLTKRFGIVGASQMPLHYLLALKSPYSPLQAATRRSHEDLISVHQFLGRIITFLFYLHAAFYFNVFVQVQIVLEKLTQFYILCGVFSVVAFTAVATTALKPVRDWSYRVFYITHVVLATALLPILYFHVHHIRIYVWETLAVYAVNVALRFAMTRTHSGVIKSVSGAGLVEINIPLTNAAGKRGGFSAWQPGQHAYVSVAGHPLLRTFHSNPFTAASIPAVDGQLRFVARVLDGNTLKLVETAGPSQKLSIEGPYGISSHPDTLLHYDRVLFVAGGVGGTFIAPLYRQLLADLSPSTGSQRRQRVNFVWIARSMADVSWALPENAKEKESFMERLRVYLTKDVDGIAVDGDGDFAIGDEDEDQVPSGEGEDGIELEEQKKLLPTDGSERKGAAGISAQAGRPDLARAVEQVFTHSSTERIAVVVCGPRSLSQSLRREVGGWVRRGRECFWWAEEFGL